MESKSISWLDSPIVRFILMILATVLLNFGLFFILNFLAPFVTGIIIGFLIAKKRDGVVVGFIGSILSYIIVFVLSEWLLGFTSAPLNVAIAVLIMGALGAAGGLIGSVISTKVRS
jgi:predicted membrane metal-binding protein